MGATYADWKDLVGRYPQLETMGDAPTVNSYFIHAAERELESRLAPYYTIPFSSNNYTAQDLTLDLTYIRYYESAKPEWAEKKSERVNKFIDWLIAGKMNMVTTSGDVVTQVTFGGGAFASTTEDYHPTFGIGQPMNFIVSSGQLYDEEDARG